MAGCRVCTVGHLATSVWHSFADGVDMPAAAPYKHRALSCCASAAACGLTVLLALKFKNSQRVCCGVFIVAEHKAKIFDSCHRVFVATSGDTTAGSCQRLGRKMYSEFWHPVLSEYSQTYLYFCLLPCVRARFMHEVSRRVFVCVRPVPEPLGSPPLSLTHI